MSVTVFIVIALLAVGCSLLVSCVLALDLREASMRDIREAEERARHEARRRGME
jgi:hypothetical protein